MRLRKVWWVAGIIIHLLMKIQSISYKSSNKKLYPFFCRTLGLDLVVRDPEGNIINPDSTGAIQLYRRVRPAKLTLYHGAVIIF